MKNSLVNVGIFESFFSNLDKPVLLYDERNTISTPIINSRISQILTRWEVHWFWIQRLLRLLTKYSNILNLSTKICFWISGQNY